MEKKINKKVKEISKSFSKFLGKYKIKSYEDFPIHGSFVTFNTLETKVNVFNLFNKNEKSGIRRLIFCCRKDKKMLKKHLYKKRELKIS